MIEHIFTVITVALAIALTSIGVGVGESLISIAALKAMNIQPKAISDINRLSVLGMALTETSAVLALVISVMLLLAPSSGNYFTSLSNLGIAFALSFSGTTIGIASAFPARAACFSAARQPFFVSKILNMMLLTTSFIQTPIIFGFIVAIIINYQAPSSESLADSLRLIASGISIGLGSIGPTIGLSKFAESANKGLGFNRHSYDKLLIFTFLSEALIETPVVFALVTSLLLLAIPAPSIFKGLIFIAAALCVGIGNSAPGISSGETASAACTQIAINQDVYPVITKTSMLAQGFIDSMTIYCWIISFLLMFFAS